MGKGWVWAVTVGLAATAAVAETEQGGPAKIVFIAGEKSHGPGDHEYEKGLRFFQHCLDASALSDRLTTELHLDGWPADPETLEDADTIVLFSDGSDHRLEDHPAFREGRLEVLRRQLDRGCGLVAIHYSTFAPIGDEGDAWLDGIGGFFDYESGPDGGWHSAIETRDYAVFPRTSHPVARGIEAFTVREEFYFRMRFRDAAPAIEPVLVFDAEDAGAEKVVAWTLTRKNGGRGFGFTGGHYHANWDLDGYRTLLLNAIVWTAGLEVPEGGVECGLTTESSAALHRAPAEAAAETTE